MRWHNGFDISESALLGTRPGGLIDYSEEHVEETWDSTSTYDDYFEEYDRAEEHSWDSTLTYEDYPKEDA